MLHLSKNNPHYSFFESLKEKHYDTLASFVPSFESEFNVEKKIFRSVIYSHIIIEITHDNDDDDQQFNFASVVANNIKQTNEFGLSARTIIDW